MDSFLFKLTTLDDDDDRLISRYVIAESVSNIEKWLEKHYPESNIRKIKFIQPMETNIVDMPSEDYLM